MRSSKSILLVSAILATICGTASAAENIGILPVQIGKGIKLPLSIIAFEEAIEKGLMTSGREVIPSPSFGGEDILSAIAKVNPTYFVRTEVEDAQREGLRVTMGLYAGSGAKINRESVTCMAPDCSLGGVVRLLAKELVRAGLPAIVASPEPPTKAPIVSEHVAPMPAAALPAPTVVEPATNPVPVASDSSSTPSWVWAAAGAGAIVAVTGAVLWAVDGKGRDCATAPIGGEACFRENNTKALGITGVVVGGTATVGALLYALWPRSVSSRTNESFAISPTPNGVLLNGRF